MTGSCISGKIAAQTLFLGASVADFNVNMSWGGQPSQLTVKLVEDRSPCLTAPYKTGNYEDDHYDSCSGDSCYIDESGNTYDSKISKEKIVPGKVYYAWNGTKFVSRYWYRQDPGFFGDKTDITYDGALDNYTASKGFDIINTAAMFRMGNFSFTGLVKSWEQNYDTGGLTYNLTLDSLDSILDNCWIILDKHIGAIFGKLDSNFYGNPTNAIKGEAGIKYFGKISQGNIPNVFNVYGFLESMGIGDFGGSNRNDNGISAAIIMDALAVLTSSVPTNLNDPGSALNYLNKRAFSPFGRILIKIPQENETYQRITPGFTNVYGFGILPITTDVTGENRCHVALDLSELPRPPLDYRIQESSMSIMSFIQQVTTATGADFYFETIPLSYNGTPYNIIKLKTITRSAQPNPKQIADTIKVFAANGVPISSARLGKEKNSNPSRIMYLGAPQQRLYQAKSYRLAFSQNQYIYHPVKRQFVEFYDNVAGLSAAGQFGKYRTPSAFSTRNTSVVNSATNKYAQLFNIDEDIKNIVDSSKFAGADSNWADNGLAGSTRIGNYGKTKSITKSIGEQTGTNTRFFPLYKDIISPFFGYKHESNFEVNTTPGQNNVFRRIRPVWMDAWTGQLLVLMEVSELPQNLSVQLISRYAQANSPVGSGMFIVTESEIRAAANSFDSFITYCHCKLFGPDLFNMLKEAYNRNGLNVFTTEGVLNKNTQSNAAGQMGQPTLANPAPNFIEMDYNLFFDIRFIKDLKILYEFVRKLSSYYGSKYLVKIPEIVAYKDQQYSNIQINSGLTTNPGNSVIQVYQGSGKIFYNYEIANDGAWEEYGNIIDDSILVGSADWYSVTDDSGKIKPILGYNSSQAIDYIGQALASFAFLPPRPSSTPSVTPTPTANAATTAANILPFSPFDFHSLSSYAARIRKLGLNINDPNNFIYDTIDVTQLQQDNYIIKNSSFSSIDAYGASLQVPAKKLYTTTSIESDFAFWDPVNLRSPCAIVNAPAIPLTSTSKFFTQDPNNSITAIASMEDLSIYLKTFNNPVFTDDDIVSQVLIRRISNVLDKNQFISFLSNDQSVNHHLMNDKVAHPYFVGIPVKSNQYCYGPWINYPDLDRSIIFPGNSSISSGDPVENLIGNTRVETKPDFAPWNYGGMSSLDRVALEEIYSELQYQQIIETATLSIPGLPIFGLGSSFTFNTIANNNITYNNQSYIANTITLTFNDRTINYPITSNLPRFGNPVYNPIIDEPTINNNIINYNIVYLQSPSNPISPIISNISCNISPQNVGTTYSFRTYTQKLGFFNKENSDRIKKATLDSFKVNKQLSNMSQSFNTKLLKETTISGRNISSESYNLTKFASAFYGTSPTNILVGMALPYGHTPGSITEIIKDAKNKSKRITIPFIRHGIDPGDSEANNIFKDSPVKGFLHDLRWATNVGSYTSTEASTELGQNYKFKSAMSMDGIFSPISFYPEKFNSTFSLLKHVRKNCPECGGLGTINDEVYDYKNKKKQNIEFPCPYCSVKRKNIDSSKTSSNKTLDVLPPYIITNNNDINNILNFNISSSDNSTTPGLTLPINMVTLQPIVVPYGEFKNINTQDKDRNRHCITVVARGNIAPSTSLSYNIHSNLKTLYDPNTGKISESNGEGVNADYYPFDILAKFNIANENNSLFPMNQRFFGLRGPLMLHAWGYDTNGYPVPNASDEPALLDEYGRAARFKLIVEYENESTTYVKLKIGDLFATVDDKNANNNNIANIIYYTKNTKTQILFKESWIDASDDLKVYKITKLENDMTTDNTSYKNLGDIITKQYKKENGRWIKQPRSTQFALNWAERPDTWPVGPVDLRWDENRRIWTMNPGASSYKFVYITLEEDLIKEQDFDETYPAKGFLDDIEYSKDPLPQGYRRLVYVKDKTGYTAPKGVKLLCRYDSDSGFYEPISKPNVVATGLISNTSKAVINMDYAQGNRTITSPTLTVSYNNPLRLNVSNNKKAIFSYMNGQWTLTSVQP